MTVTILSTSLGLLSPVPQSKQKFLRCHNVIKGQGALPRTPRGALPQTPRSQGTVLRLLAQARILTVTTFPRRGIH